MSFESKTKNVTFKREHWGKRFVNVARFKGRIVSWQRWSPKISKKQLRNKLSRTGTFKKDTRKFFAKRSPTVEKTFSNPKIDAKNKRVSFSQRLPSGRRQYGVLARLKDGSEVGARSMQRNARERSLYEMREEALENLFLRLSQAAGVYDEEVGEQIFEEQVEKLEEGVVFYESSRLFQTDKTTVV